jgi:integrase
MQFLNKGELRRLLTVAYKQNENHALAILVAFIHGLRVSELIAIVAPISLMASSRLND